MSLPLVLLPGMMCDSRLFGPQIAALGLDRAIHLAPISGHDSIAALATEVLADAPPRFALAGLSMGGIVAMEMMVQAPGRIERLALRNRPDRQEALREVPVPALVLCGRHDRLCPVERHELMHALIPGSRLEIVEGAAHLPTLEQPEATTAALARWLAA